ncbi:hypothetical protein SBV1_770010 [Verrucomicrobia bacterium]|nr:hypothetical protein SBV1_770010 [Verrucomicrobiota bacterium]
MGVGAFPRGCDPTYAFGGVLQQISGAYAEILNAASIGVGGRGPYLNYLGIYDGCSCLILTSFCRHFLLAKR